MTKTFRPALTSDDAARLLRLLDNEIGAYANFMESALLSGNTDRAVELAKERAAMHDTRTTLRQAMRAVGLTDDAAKT